MMEQKISIRFYNGREVRAIWDDACSSWLFSVVDIVGILSGSKNPRNYWKVLKHRLKEAAPELVTKCNQLKLLSSDGKRYLTDCLSQCDILLLAENVPSKQKGAFVRWFIAGENGLDTKSREKAYTLWESSAIDTIKIGTVKGLQQIHGFIFGGLYDFAGKIRTKNIAKGGFQFAMAQFLDATLATIERMPDNTIDEIIDKYVEMNVAHPFMEGNGRSTRIWLDMLLKDRLKVCVDWSKIDKSQYLAAMKHSVTDSREINRLIKGALTNDINSREMFMKGIDYSYYYEQSEDLPIISEEGGEA